MSEETVEIHQPHTILELCTDDGGRTVACQCVVTTLEDGEIVNGDVPSDLPVQGPDCPHDEGTLKRVREARTKNE